MKKIIYILMLIILLSSVKSALTDNVDVALNLDHNISDYTGNFSSLYGYSANVTEFSLKGGFFDGSASRVCINDANYLEGKSTFSAFYLFNKSAADGSNSYPLSKSDGATTSFQIVYRTASSAYFLVIGTDGTSVDQSACSNADCNDGDIHLLGFVYNGTNAGIYLDGVRQANPAATGNLNANNGNICIGGTSTGLLYSQASIYGMWIWDKELELNEVLNLNETLLANFTKYPFEAGGGSPPATPTLTLNANLVNNTINFNDNVLSFTYNGTFTDNTKDIVNISFYINQVFNSTLLDVNLSNNNVFNITIGSYSDTLNISFNASNFEVSAQKGTYVYNVDTINPVIQSSFVNEKQYYLGDDFNLYVNFTDDNLYAYNITFRDSDNLVVKNVFLDSIAVNFKENNTPMTLDTEDNYTILIEVWDSHTANKVKTKDIDYLINGIEYDNNIKIYSDEIKKTTTYLNDIQDRYLLDLEFNDNLFTHIIYIESPNYIKYLPISKYKGHFIIDFKYWVDFENEQDITVSVNKINDNLYKITLTSLNKFNAISFKSIGDLNYESASYSYSVINIYRLNNALLTSIDNTLSLILEVLNMIPITLVWIVLTIGGILLIIKGYSQIGFWIYLLSSIFDLIILAMTYINFNQYVSNATVGFLISISMVTLIPIWLLSRLFIGIQLSKTG